jgi:hypothetical protein
MLTVVPNAINQNTRQVVLRHPNSMDCTVWRKVVKRVEPDPETGAASEDMGMPTIGGMGVLRSEDEDDYDYEELGPARCLFGGVYTPTDMNERDDAVLQQPMQEAQIEPLAEPGTPQWFLADTTDLVMITPGLGVVLAFDGGDRHGHGEHPALRAQAGAQSARRSARAGTLHPGRLNRETDPAQRGAVNRIAATPEGCHVLR